jgi:hypothetical protein
MLEADEEEKGPVGWVTAQVREDMHRQAAIERMCVCM